MSLGGVVAGSSSRAESRSMVIAEKADLCACIYCTD